MGGHMVDAWGGLCWHVLCELGLPLVQDGAHSSIVHRHRRATRRPKSGTERLLDRQTDQGRRHC